MYGGKRENRLYLLWGGGESFSHLYIHNFSPFLDHHLGFEPRCILCMGMHGISLLPLWVENLYTLSAITSLPTKIYTNKQINK